MATFYDATPQMLQAWFMQIDTDRGGTLNVGEVQRALSLAGLNFSGKFVNSLINLVDNDCSGQLSVQEFVNMHAYLKKAYYTFVQCDADRSGILTINEMPGAFATLGFQLDMSPNGSFYSFLKSYDFDKSGRFDQGIFIAMFVALSNAQRVHQRLQPMAPTLTFDLFVWSLAQM